MAPATIRGPVRNLSSTLLSMSLFVPIEDVYRLPQLDTIRSLLGTDGYRRPRETHVNWTRLRRKVSRAPLSRPQAGVPPHHAGADQQQDRP